MSTADVAGIAAAAGADRCRQPYFHAAVVARQLGKVCLVNCRALQVRPQESVCVIGTARLAEGEVITLDADQGRVYAGRCRSCASGPSGARSGAGWRESARRGPTSVANSSLSEVSQAGAALFRTLTSIDAPATKRSERAVTAYQSP